MISDDQIHQAIKTGVCPLCHSPMIATNRGKSSVCSNNGTCSLGVLPACETYEPAKKAFSKQRRSKAACRYPRFEKIVGKKLYTFDGKSWKITKRISLKSAKRLTMPIEIQGALIEGFEKRNEISCLPENQKIGTTNKGRLVVFQRID